MHDYWCGYWRSFRNSSCRMTECTYLHWDNRPSALVFKWLLGKNKIRKWKLLESSRYQSAPMSGSSGSKSLTFTSVSSPYWMQLSIWDRTYCILQTIINTRQPQALKTNLTKSNQGFITTRERGRETCCPSSDRGAQSWPYYTHPPKTCNRVA